MEIANLGNVELAYQQMGEGEPVLLIHGFASTAHVNWVGPGWFDSLVKNGYRVIAFDNRGHGQSTKFYNEDDYRLETLAQDAASLMEFLDLDAANIMGYSMGGRITAMLSYLHPKKVKKAVFAGSGYNMIDGGFPSSDIKDGLLAASMDEISTETGRAFRTFAEQTKSDLQALAACIMGARSNIEEKMFRELMPETLVTIGTEDTVAIDGEKLANIIPNGIFAPIPKRNHMNAVGDKIYKQNVLEFFQKGV